MQKFTVYIEKGSREQGYEMIADSIELATRPDIAVSNCLKRLGSSHSTLMNKDYIAPLKLRADGMRLRIEVQRID